MQRRQHDATSSGTHSSYQDERQYYCLHSHDGYSNSVLYQVVPAGRNFFHIMEVTSKPHCTPLMAGSFRHLDDFTAPSPLNNCHTGPSIEVCPVRVRFHQCSYLEGKVIRDGI